VAFVTGASRGIGKACAEQLAQAGFDVAVTARTVNEGEEREHSSTMHKTDTRPLPGSLATTAQVITDVGREALVLPADLLDRTSLGAAVATVLERWGRIDVLVNNGRYIGPGHMDRVLETPLELLDKQLEANVMAPIALAPPAPAGEGGWGLGYAMSKAALHRLVGILHRELAGSGVVAVNLDPGFVATERMFQDMGEFGFDASAGAPPVVIGAVVAWLATDPRAAEWDGGVVPAQQLCADLGLVPGFTPVPNPV
jgi:NAD(P)-dependent dehydrogenase (short-subunit alcohol dehydrogenase family)